MTPCVLVCARVVPVFACFNGAASRCFHRSAVVESLLQEIARRPDGGYRQGGSRGGGPPGAHDAPGSVITQVGIA